MFELHFPKLLFLSNIYLCPYIKSKSKEFYCRCYSVKLFLCFAFFISPPFSISLLYLLLYEEFLVFFNYYNFFFFFWGGFHLFGDFFFFFFFFSFLGRVLCNIWKNHYKQLENPIIIFENFLWIFLASPTTKTHHETFWIFYDKLLLINLTSKMERFVKIVSNFIKFEKIVNTPLSSMT